MARAAVLGLLLAGLAGACDAHPQPPKAAPERDVALIRREGNHLVGQASPYLEQHAHNPVDWYPWGPEALDRARRERRLVFLSIGYATCHWCHVMEKESFEDDETARLLNSRYVSIKVDREARPDLDALFIEAVSRLGQSPGWPLTVILTPDLEPVFGGTYLPRTGAEGRPGLLDVLREVDDGFRKDGPALARRGHDLMAQIAAKAAAPAAPDDVELSSGLLRDAMAALARARDPTEGGFGSRQKFPDTPLLLAELRSFERTGDAGLRAHLDLTLDRMMRGGVRDQVAGSFHRYATDRRWRVPHFEKTLYDNAQLAALYLEASRTLAPAYERVTRAVLDDLLASWQRPDGGFVVGFDADDAGGEGAYYTFTPAELRRALGDEDARLAGAILDVTERGEASLGGRSVLRRRPDEEIAHDVHLSPDAVEQVLARALPRLAGVRAARPAPAADDKELAAWNGLAVMALADAGRALGEPRYVEAAERAGRFLVGRCWDAGARIMRRGYRRGAPLGEGFLDDHALAALGLLRLHAADGDLAWLAAARAVADAMVERFWDEAHRTFVHVAAGSSEPAALPLRRPDLDDGVLPSGGAAAILALLQLGAVAGDAALLDRGERALRATAPHVRAEPFASGFLLVAIDHAVAAVHEVVIAGDPEGAGTRALVHEIAQLGDAQALPVLLPAGGAPPELGRAFPALAGKVALDGKPTAYVCRRGACDAPAYDPAALRDRLGR